MDRTDFNAWYADYCVKYPATNEWLRSHSTDITATLQSWFDVLSDCDLADCLAATKDIFSGRESPIAAYDRERTASIIKSIARTHAANRVAGKRPEHWQTSPDDPGVCEQCRGSGIVTREDHLGRKYGWRCPCTAGETYAASTFKPLRGREKKPLAVWGEGATVVSDVSNWRWEG